ncbi:MAG: hypothetical protein HQL84_11840 [Magnetococcales bacterium]|nr:hypothetical protein [Magnetococcales bacterium]MBF0150726.1 hypothetical protein [Magnetococcales bacterium]MBF0174048.1 hypothetical protein [Magnetococcales bacterium]MBF0346045.1 hypothetical protein [Magnetococcales bacterium]MBF0631816.1 hypothetical protein [Magnetococcales bacterium]
MSRVAWLLLAISIGVIGPVRLGNTKDPNHVPLAKDGYHDPSNRSLDALQKPAQALNAFPHDRLGEVNWVQTLDKKLIDPRADILGKKSMKVLEQDIIMTNTKSMPYVRFPHGTHTRWLDCTNCHPKPFLPVIKGNAISMDAVLRGQFCGACHGRVAFSPFICERCHSEVHPGSPKKWW